MTSSSPLELFRPAVRAWFTGAFSAPTAPQTLGWPALARGESTLLLAPTGSGKTLAAFLQAIDRLMFSPEPPAAARSRVLYVSPLKALAVDVERNLRAPIAGVAQVAAERGDGFRLPSVWVRTGDTPAAERARFQRQPADIVITTPESLYLLLTSRSREALRSIDTVIVDEIHALVPTKRGAHLALSLERLEALAGRRLQRIGLSATQRPLDEVARFLGGAEWEPAVERAAEEPLVGGPQPVAAERVRGEFADRRARTHRPVTIVDAGQRKPLALTIEVPVEDMARMGQPPERGHGPMEHGPTRASIWTHIYPRLLELIRAHASTLIFVNSRRVAERLAAALNELAGELLVHAHHGSIARAQRVEIEDKLKRGAVKALVATSSLELGIDMGAIDLVVQIEAPPSVSSALQRIGRAGHQVDAPSEGVLFPKYRSDLLACAAVTRAMREGEVETSRYPRNPLDVLAQQVVAMAATDVWHVDELFAVVRRAAPFADLSRGIFDGVLELLAGRYEADELADLKPRLTWDRESGALVAREGAQRVAIVNGGTIPDRGLYGVYLAGAEKRSARVGELDEEMVFESRVGETFLLGASTWRIEEITHDRVLVSPAPGQPGKMPFWHGDAASRPIELGRRIGQLVRELGALPKAAAVDRLVAQHDLGPAAAENLLQYLEDQRAAAGAVPDDRTLLVERCRDEQGDWRVCLLSPLGGRIHAPWSMAITAKLHARLGLDVETMWTNDGIVVRFPESEAPPPVEWLLPDPDEVEALVLEQLGGTALFAAKFREIASRSLLLTKRRPGARTPLWHLRKRAADLLGVASKYGGFPMLLEAYRECLRDVFDMPALVSTLRDVQARRIRAVAVDSTSPSPFASAILFGFVANFIYDGDAPLAERRAQALSIDQTQLKELLGDAELRELLDAEALAEVERELQHLLPPHRARTKDAVHDLLLRLGDLTAEALAARSQTPEVAASIAALVEARRAVEVRLEGQTRFIAVEHASRFRDALGVTLPPGLPASLLRPSADALGDLLSRYARTHGPFTLSDLGERYGLSSGVSERALQRLVKTGRLLEGAFRPHGTHREWCDAEVLRMVRRRSLARLRHQVEPVEAPVLGRLATTWHGLVRKRRGVDALLDVIERLQGAPLTASLLEAELLPARLEAYSPADLDALLSAGEVVWAGVEPLGERDGRIALYLTDAFAQLWRPRASDLPLSVREEEVVAFLRQHGASFFAAVHAGVGGGFPAPTVDALWSLVWRGLVTNDGFGPLRAHLEPAERREKRLGLDGRAFRSWRAVPASAEGRWSLLSARTGAPLSVTEWSANTAQQLLARHGLVTRETAALEAVEGGFSAVYDVLKRMEETGRVRRGYFVAGIGAMQFALPPVLELLRALKAPPAGLEVVSLEATDPANPYGGVLPWPAFEGGSGKGPARAVGAKVVLVDGALAAYLGKGGRQLFVALPPDEPERSQVAEACAAKLVELARRAMVRRAGLLIGEINGGPAHAHPFGEWLARAGFQLTPQGFHLSRM